MNYKKISTGISWVLHPFLLPIYMMALLLTMTTFAHYSPNVKFYLLWVVALYAVIIPVLSLGVLRSLGRISDYRVDDLRRCSCASSCSPRPAASCCASGCRSTGK